MCASSSATCSFVIGSPSRDSSLASATQSFRQVWYRVSEEKRFSMYSDA